MLDVGCGFAGIAPYLRCRVIGLDTSLIVQPPGLAFLRATGTALPIRTDSVDVCVCVDVLEHLPGSERRRVLEEMLRTTRSRIYLAVPCGQRAAASDERLNTFHRRQHGCDNPWLLEHRQQGVPDEAEVLAMIREAIQASGREVRVAWVRPTSNLRLREIIWKIRHARAPWLSRYVNALIILALPVLASVNVGRCYRLLVALERDA